MTRHPRPAWPTPPRPPLRLRCQGGLQGRAQPTAPHGRGERAGQPGLAQAEVGRVHPGAVLVRQPARAFAQREARQQAFGDLGRRAGEPGVEPGERRAGVGQRWRSAAASRVAVDPRVGVVAGT